MGACLFADIEAVEVGGRGRKKGEKVCYEERPLVILLRIGFEA